MISNVAPAAAAEIAYRRERIGADFRRSRAPHKMPSAQDGTVEPKGVTAVSCTDVHRYLADLGERIAVDGPAASHAGLALVSGAAHRLAPAVAAVLTDPDQPAVATQRALAVGSAAILRDVEATTWLRRALVDDIAARDGFAAAA